MSSESDLKDALDVDPQLSDEEIDEMFSVSVKKSKSKMRRGTISRVVVIATLIVVSAVAFGAVINRRTTISPAKKTPTTKLNISAPTTIYASRYQHGHDQLVALSMGGELQRVIYDAAPAESVYRLISDAAHQKLYVVFQDSNGDQPVNLVLFMIDNKTNDITQVEKDVTNMVISPDGTQALISYTDNRVATRDLSTGKETELLPAADGDNLLGTGWIKDNVPVLSFGHIAVSDPKSKDISYTEVIRYVTNPSFHAYEIFRDETFYDDLAFQLDNGNYLVSRTYIHPNKDTDIGRVDEMDFQGNLVKNVIGNDASIVSCNAVNRWCVARVIGDGTGNGGVPHLLVGHADGNYTQIPDGYETATL